MSVIDVGKLSTNTAACKLNMPTVATRIATVRQRLEAACVRAGRNREIDAETVRLIAVSKHFPAEAVAAAAAAGQREFGENYVQEGIAKRREPICAAIEGAIWHFIGPIQANKTRQIAENFDWAHGVDRLRIAERLSEQRPATLPPLEICVQVNISDEVSKSGCTPAETIALCTQIARLPRLRLRGLMTMPAPATTPEDSRPAFRALRELADAVRASGGVDSRDFNMLSMGMSDDFEIAIEEGATLIRVGTAIFGPRAAPPPPAAA